MVESNWSKRLYKQSLRKLRKNRKKKRSLASKDNKPIEKDIRRYNYWFPKNWDWHKRVQYISKRLIEGIKYRDNSIDLDW